MTAETRTYEDHDIRLSSLNPHHNHHTITIMIIAVVVVVVRGRSHHLITPRSSIIVVGPKRRTKKTAPSNKTQVRTAPTRGTDHRLPLHDLDHSERDR